MTDALEKPKSWRYRVIEATSGNQTFMGAVLIAILAPFSIQNPPRFSTDGAFIDREGEVWCSFQGKDMHWQTIRLFHATELATELNRVADTCKLDDVERLALFDEAQKWIVKDHRAQSRLQ